LLKLSTKVPNRLQRRNLFDISSTLDSCSTSQLFFSQSAKLTLVSDQKDFLPLQHTAQEMIPGGELGAKSGRRADRWIDFAANRILRPGERFCSLGK